MSLGETTEIVIRDRVSGITKITGLLIADLSTQRERQPHGNYRPKPRWGHNRIVKLQESGGYLLLREALSLTYHRVNTSCTTINRQPSGEQCSASEMFAEIEQLGMARDEAVSCDRCQPQYPEELRATALVRYEMPRRQWDQCENPGQVVQRLTQMRRFSGVWSSEVAEPIRGLIEQARLHDPDWAEADMPVVEIR